MNEKNYTEMVLSIESNNIEEITERLNNPEIVRLLHGSVGLVTEAGELLDTLKKHIYYGKEVDIVNIIEELGDISYYYALLCDVLNVSRKQIEEKNIKKLKARYPNGFSKKKAIKRNLNNERKILEET